MPVEQHRFSYQPISCHTFNKSRSEIALSPNNNEVHVFKFIGNKWELYEKLSEHVQRVTDVDWGQNSDKIVSCGVDRNAYVWVRQDNIWKPTLVILRINRAATCVRWSPLENKFAVGSGARLISICYFDKEQDWFVSKQIKKPLRSTITCIDWHPSNYILACGSTDFKTRIFSAYVKDVESKPSSLTWGAKLSFGTLLGEFSNGGGGWVHSVCFSANGDKVAWVGHDSSVSVVDSTNQNLMVSIKTDLLPFKAINWLRSNVLIVAGHDCYPVAYKYDGSNIIFGSKLEKETSSGGDKLVNSARAMFKNFASQGTNVNVTTLPSTHQNSINQISIHTGEVGNIKKFCTGGVDGLLCVWKINPLEEEFKSLELKN